jgi:hypothetical protein
MFSTTTLPEFGADLLRKCARDGVERAARGERHDERDRPRRECLSRNSR